MRTDSSSKSRSRERLDGAEQVGHREAAVDGEALHLVEHRRVPGVERLVAVGAARARRRRSAAPASPSCGSAPATCACAACTCSSCAELDVDRVLHRAGRVCRRDVERLEVVPVVLDLGTLGDPVAEPDEDVLELAPDLRDEVEVTVAATVPTDGEVDRSGRRRPPARPPARLARGLDAARSTAARYAPTAWPAAAGRRRRRSLIASLTSRRGRALPEEPARRLVELVASSTRRRSPRVRRRARRRARARSVVERHATTCRACRRWRAASKHSTVVAIATFSDSAAPAIGIVTAPSRCGRARRRQPARLVARRPARSASGEVDARRTARRRGPRRRAAARSPAPELVERADGRPDPRRRARRRPHRPIARTTFGFCTSTDAAPGDDDAVGARRLGAADDRAEVARIGDVDRHDDDDRRPDEPRDGVDRHAVVPRASTGCGVGSCRSSRARPRGGRRSRRPPSRACATSGANARPRPGRGTARRATRATIERALRRPAAPRARTHRSLGTGCAAPAGALRSRGEPP